jgi:hypothetical protein
MSEVPVKSKGRRKSGDGQVSRLVIYPPISVTLPKPAWEYLLSVLAKQGGLVGDLPDLRPLNISGAIILAMERQPKARKE